MKHFRKLLLTIVGVSLLLTLGCETEPVATDLSTSNIQVYSYEQEDLTNIIGVINSNTPISFSRDTNEQSYWIDTENIYGAVDSIGNKSYSFRLYFNNMPQNTLYNVVVTDRVNNKIAPFVVAYSTANGNKVPTHYYGLESFLEQISSKPAKSTRVGTRYDYDYEEIVDCGEIAAEGHQSSNNNTSGSGGTGHGDNNIGSGFRQSGNTYGYLGRISVISWGSSASSGGGVTATIEVGELVMFPPEEALRINPDSRAYSRPDERVICPEGEVIVVTNDDCPNGFVKDKEGNCVEKPCEGNPVKTPKITPSPKSDGTYNNDGGRYGCTRTGGNCGNNTKMHNGVDITATPNSNIHSMYSGTVTSVRDSFAPGEYKENSYGNYVTVTSIIDGETIHIKYNHLNTVSVTVGQPISAGEIMGLSGTTGNAAINPNTGMTRVIPHVHVQSYNANWTQSLNTENYLQTQFDNNNNPVPSNCR